MRHAGNMTHLSVGAVPLRAVVANAQNRPRFRPETMKSSESQSKVKFELHQSLERTAAAIEDRPIAGERCSAANYACLISTVPHFALAEVFNLRAGRQFRPCSRG